MADRAFLITMPDVPDMVTDELLVQDITTRLHNAGGPSAHPYPIAVASRSATVTVAEHIGQWLTEHEELPAGERFISNTDLAEDGPVTAEFAPYMVNVYREVRA